MIYLFFNVYISSQILYYEPRPNSQFVKTSGNIILGFENQLSDNIPENLISIIGSKSGHHSAEFTFTENNRKLIINPDNDFLPDENVAVTVQPYNIFSDNRFFSGIAYSFKTESIRKSVSSFKENPELYSYRLFENGLKLTPDELPQLSVTVNNSPAPGKIFMSNFPFGAVPNTPHLLIAENDGRIYTGLKLGANVIDFKKAENGNLVFFNTDTRKYYELEEEYQLIDSFYCGNGYITDGHELRILNNRHALLMSYDTQTVDMSQIISGGDPNCIVTGLIIQEIDENKNVVFQWRSWDYIPITDAQHQNMTASYLDYIHGNAIDLDHDGNILISSRHLDEITKINRQTGNIIWRLGGPRNMFTFTNDPGRFYYQHGIRRLPNGNILFYDNGNFHTPPHSRAVEYRLDETNMTATLVWQYRNTPDNFGFAMGFAQRLNNGNTLISWGSTNPTVSEVTPDGNIALEMSLPPGIFTYRAFKFDWNGLPGYIDLTYIKPPTAYKLKQNYPNPFNPVTKIEFDLPENTFVSLNIYDILGRVVRSIYNTDLNAGYYSVDFNSTGISSGIYFYRLNTETFSETKKMVLVK